MKIAICVPISNEVVFRQFYESSMRLDRSGIETEPFVDRHPQIDINRNNIAEKALHWGADYLLWLDADQTYPPDMIQRLLAHQKDIVGGITPQRLTPYLPTIYKWQKGNRMHHILEIDKEELIKPDAMGLPGSLIKRKVFETIPFPWFENTLTFKHDILFCMKCYNFGFKIYCDLTLTYGHITVDIVKAPDMIVPRMGTMEAGFKWKEIRVPTAEEIKKGLKTGVKIDASKSIRSNPPSSSPRGKSKSRKHS